MNLNDLRYEQQKSAVKDSITKLSIELVRLARLPYSSWKNKEQIRSLDKQIEYLEEVLAAFERDQKKL